MGVNNLPRRLAAFSKHLCSETPASASALMLNSSEIYGTQMRTVFACGVKRRFAFFSTVEKAHFRGGTFGINFLAVIFNVNRHAFCLDYNFVLNFTNFLLYAAIFRFEIPDRERGGGKCHECRCGKYFCDVYIISFRVGSQ